MKTQQENQWAWKEAYNLGIELIDKEHQQLFRVINRLFTFAREEKKSQWACQEAIKYFKEHALKHFADEEAYMESMHYEELETHRQLHREFREKTLALLEQELEEKDYSPNAVEHFLGVCAGWLIGHTLTEDRAIAGESVHKWVELLPEQEYDAIKKVILQLLYDMFHLESQIISETYKGEKFGKGVYYRLVYGSKQSEETWEIFMVFEERLLVRTVGSAMGIQTDKLDAMLIHAARYTAQQFVGRIMELLPSSGLHELREENLLTYEQFEQVFAKQTLQASLLFDTGEGYFAFCAIAPHLLQKGVGTPIEAGNAIAEVEKYLQKREEPPKPKILVVDDSMTMRQGLKELLREDYEVSTAESGVFAIQALTLDQPDLVLLDYEMPICDGHQVMQMIRALPACAELPIIFLTGRTDRESITNIVALKPQGYLLKFLKPAEIKKKIDDYFSSKKA